MMNKEYEKLKKAYDCIREKTDFVPDVALILGAHILRNAGAAPDVETGIAMLEEKIENGEGDYANPASILKALELLLRHIALPEKADRLAEALRVCTETERRVVVTGHRDGATCRAFGDYLLEKL